MGDLGAPAAGAQGVSAEQGESPGLSVWMQPGPSSAGVSQPDLGTSPSAEKEGVYGDDL